MPSTENTPVASFADYLALETRLFKQLGSEQVYARIDPARQNAVNRYYRGNLSDPERWSPNWNRSFELSTDAPKAGVLLLHGLSISPYSLRTLAQQLHRAAVRYSDCVFRVMAPPLPDWSRCAGRIWQRRCVDVPSAHTGWRPAFWHIVGYSNGRSGRQLCPRNTDPTLPQTSGLVLLSPAIGVSSAAALAVWQARIGHLLGLEKLAWNSILPRV
ncbi:MAG: hypothetical protein R3F53_14920 [Gammaproteobacteria bacterium]